MPDNTSDISHKQLNASMVNEIEEKIFNYKHIVPRTSMTEINKAEKHRRTLYSFDPSNHNQVPIAVSQGCSSNSDKEILNS